MDILMPQLGETVAEGKITKWFKSAGDAVKPGDNLFEIETDKVSMEVPATEAGVLSEIRVVEGEVVPVGAVVGVIGASAGAGVSAPAKSAPPASAPEPKAAATPPPTGYASEAPAATPSKPSQPVKLDPFFEVRTPARNFGAAKLPGGVSVTPLARRLASEAGIDLSRLRGSGPHGRIVARDIEDAPRPAARAALAEGLSADQVKALFDPAGYEEVPLDSMPKTIAARLQQAKQTIPHFYLTTDITIDRLIAIREEANGAAPKDRDGKPAFKLSLNDFVIRALALALQQVPAANAAWAGDRFLRFKHSDIGVAVALDGGLIAPIIRNAETKSLSTLSAEMKDLAARAKEKKLKPTEYQGGSSAISNLGMYGVREFAAIINPPQATILAVGASRRQAIERPDGGVAFASMLTATLSCDHRVVDGALGAELLAAVKALLETPVTILV
ncbi:MAG TPA: pyruvate dehydrogenase complex dihydrolipoamide acetyltransferase [Xanthobacteraceae bacterium]|jgi:pyruvate dehydrogenase E2 component (dihydrolipoamide acetyltransferase)